MNPASPANQFVIDLILEKKAHWYHTPEPLRCYGPFEVRTTTECFKWMRETLYFTEQQIQEAINSEKEIEEKYPGQGRDINVEAMRKETVANRILKIDGIDRIVIVKPKEIDWGYRCEVIPYNLNVNIRHGEFVPKTEEEIQNETNPA